MATFRKGIMDGTGYGKHLPTLFKGCARGDQGTAPDGGFYHQYAEAKAADDAISLGEMSGSRRITRMRDHNACRSANGVNRRVIGTAKWAMPLACRAETSGPSALMPKTSWINHVDTRAEHRDSLSAFQSPLVGYRVDTQCQAAGNNKTAGAKCFRECPSILSA